MIRIFVDSTMEYETIQRLTRGVPEVHIYLGIPDRIRREKPRRKYQIKPRFFFFLGLAIMAIILFIIYTRPETLFTSNYWRG